MQVQTKKGIFLALNDKPFASGGEGDLHRIVSPAEWSSNVVKLYRLDKRTLEREQKIAYLIANPPDIPAGSVHCSIVWPKEMVFIQGKFAGFVMLLAHGEKLELLCYPKLDAKRLPLKEWQRFDFQNPDVLSLRLKLCYNIAVAVYQIHRLYKYVFVDLKPENIMVQPNGLISIIDMDSVEVLQDAQPLFLASVNTPDYTPPEYYRGMNPERDGIPETWDRFSLSVIFYRILCGIHPFVGTCKTPYENITDVSGKIRENLFANGKNASFFSVKPLPHQRFSLFSGSIQEIFRECFDKGHFLPHLRPNAEKWALTLSSVLMARAPQTSHRKLPSIIVGVAGNLSSAALKLPTELNFFVPPMPIYIDLLPQSIKDTIKNFFQTSNKAYFAEQLRIKQQTEQQTRKIVRNFVQIFAQIHEQFERAQAEILEQEYKTLEKMRQKLNLIDQKAQVLINEEVAAFKVITRSFEENWAILSSQIKRLDIRHSPHLQHAKYLEIQHQIAELRRQEMAQKDLVEQRLREKLAILEKKNQIIENKYKKGWLFELEESLKKLHKRRTELQKKEYTEKIQLKNGILSKQLAEYSIYDNARPIFAGQAVDSEKIAFILYRYGIITAADIIDVDSEGRFVGTNGARVKVNGVGRQKAMALVKWRERIEQNLKNQVQQIYYSNYIDQITAKYEAQYLLILSQENQMRTETHQKIINLPQTQLPEKIINLKKMKELYNKAQAEKIKIQNAFERKRIALNKRLENLKKTLDRENNTKQAIAAKNKAMEQKKTLLQQAEHLQKNKENALQNTKTHHDQQHQQLHAEAKNYAELLLKQVKQLNDITDKALKANQTHYSQLFLTRFKEFDRLRTELIQQLQEMEQAKRAYLNSQ